MAKNEERLAVRGRLQEERFVHGAVEHHGRGQLPIAGYLPKPMVLRRADGLGNLQKVRGRLGPELGKPLVAGFAEFRLAA